ncbi:FAD-dependent oxidoreductase [Amycolatopsis sp. CA-230715]|uniref:FAD-dependent oxidoreductase n=1 Tax=Amycolatopsis sp. CA-230715 TaxID=2745196 RepID=UPI001C018732|nr:FAD-dependent monooxygenase [Amycolatopsis sp. CA-230715]QWF77374.1 FAD-dependent urate hydroxylase [Amycolatopsis sp. CA-230715]
MGRAIIAGAGIVGLSTALSLRQAGFEVAVRERAPRLRATGAVLGVWPHTIRELERLGLGPRLAKIKAEPGFVRYRDFSGTELTTTGMPPTRTVHRARLSALLASSVGEDDLRTGKELVGYVEDHDGVTVHYADGDHERADLLVGADGLNSRVRAILAPGTGSRHQGGHHVWRAVLRFDGDIGDGCPVLGRDRTRGTLTRLADGSCCWVIAQFGTTTGATGNSKEEALSRVPNLHDGTWPFALRDAVLATPEHSVLHSRVAVVPAISRWAGDRVVLAGDAAHAMSPHIGSGASLGIEDARVLGDRLSRAEIAPALAAYQDDRLDRYRQMRRYANAMAAAPTPLSYVERFAEYLNWLHTSRTPPGYEVKAPYRR